MLTATLERHQLVLYVVAIGVGAAAGLLLPGLASGLEPAITPVLGLLLLATFLGVPMLELVSGLRDRRFLVGIAVVNMVVAPIVAAVLSRFVADDRALVLGVLLVLLAPCIDYVVVFTGIAGGSAARLLAVTPLLLVGQLLLLPALLPLLAGPEALAVLDPAPILTAFLVLVVAPAGLAAIVQALAPRLRLARTIRGAAASTMVPLMMLTLAIVVASQIPLVADRFGDLVRVLPLLLCFAVVMIGLGALVSRAVRLERRDAIATTFSGMTRNSLVVLPLALALPAEYALVPAVVVSQTLVEVLVLIGAVRLVPLLESLVSGLGRGPRGR